VDGGNEDSVVLRFEYNYFSILFTGDIGFESEQALIEEGADIDADVLKVGHHGSAYSTSSVFLECVSPQQAVISVVANSPYGHPAPATIERLEEYGCQIRRTDHEGAILYLLD
jgi:beta-lactamase superfamily II metal-dependent hydrolase